MIEIETLTLERKTDAPTGQTEKVCFVCTGNTCRSPMAEAAFNDLAHGRMTAVSRGLAVREGDPVSRNALSALKAKGIPTDGIEKHTAANIDEAILKQSALILCMTDRHAMSLLCQYPAFASKIRTLGGEIPDPYGGDEETYLACLEAILSGLKATFPFLES